jgi:SPP1 gp7 family putative phage head morphogenesis protein
MALKDLFKKATPEQPPSTAEILIEDSGLYSEGSITKYDPDDLKGSKGHGIYAKMMIDDQVKGVIQFKIHAVLSRNYFFDIGTDDSGQPRPEHEDMVKFFEKTITLMKGSFSDKLAGVLSALPHGFSVSEKVYTAIPWDGRTYWGIKDIKLRPQDSFDGGFVVDKHGNVERLEQKTGSNRVQVPIKKVIHFVHQPEVDIHYGDSDLRACYRNYWSKDNIIKFQNIHLERHAGGFIWAKVKGKLPPDQKTSLRDFLKNISARTGAQFPESVDLKMEQPSTTDLFEKAIAQHDKGIAKSVLVPNLLGITEQGTTGSYAQSQTQIGAFFWILDAIAKRLEEVLNEQLFRELAIWNFGTEDYPPFKFQPISDEVAREIAKTWGELVSKGAATKSDSDEAYVRNLVNFPEKAEPELPEEGELPSDGVIPAVGDWLDELPAEVKEQVLRQFAEKPWLRRVNFAKIEGTMDKHDEALTSDLTDAMAAVTVSLESQIAKIWGDRSGQNVKPNEILEIKIPASVVSQIRKVTKENLVEALNESYAQAKTEIPKETFKKIIRSGMDIYPAERFLKSKAMKVAGIIEKDVLSATQQVLENGIKYDKTLYQTVESMRDNTNLVALLPEVDAAGRAINVPARLTNIARTNTADAVNQARSALFGSPELKGFVQAFEYSAILDEATTDICGHLNGRIMRDFGYYTPPNHFMCRSLLIPITQVDDWDGKTSGPPRVEPQKGFS